MFILILFQVVHGVCRVVTFWPSDQLRTYVGLGLIFIQFFVPFFVLIFCYSKIVRVLTRRINNNLTSSHDKTVTQITDTNKEKFQLARKNTIKTLLIVGLCFIICWSQNQIMFFMYNCGYDINFNSTYVQYTILMVFLNCTVNPFIYLMKYRDYQEALRLFLHCSEKAEADSSSNLSIGSIKFISTN